MGLEFFGWIGTTLLITSAWIVGNKKRNGFLVSISGQLIYIIISSCRGNWSIVFMSTIFCFMAVRNWFHWGVDENT